MSLDCREVLARAYLFLDGEGLSQGERDEISRHLEACQPCFRRYGVEEEVAGLIHRIRGTCRCPDTLRTRIVVLLDQD